MKIQIIKDQNVSDINIFDGNGISIREVYHNREYVDIRTLKIGAAVDGGTIIRNDYL